jgi:hypothetical protein
MNARITGADVRARAELLRKVTAAIPGKPSPRRVGYVLGKARRVILLHREATPRGIRVSPAVIKLLGRIEQSAERWQNQLVRVGVHMPELRSVQQAAARKTRLYARGRGRPRDARRQGLIGELFQVYATACRTPKESKTVARHGFQRVINLILKDAGLPPVTKHELAALQQQFQQFDSFIPAEWRKSAPD